MTNENFNPTDSGSHMDLVDSLDIKTLRTAASALGISARRDWNKQDFIYAIKERQSAQPAVEVVFDPSKNPRPGFARLIVHRDPSPNHKNSPIHVGLNGQIFQIPRNIPVDIPKEFIEVLSNARSVQTREQESSTRENPSGVYKDEEQLSYPFQVMAVTPGEWVNPYDTRARKFALRSEFNRIHGAWPTEGELAEFKKTKTK